MTPLFLAFAPAAFATHPAPTCGPTVTSVYEMKDFNPNANTPRTIWAPSLACDGKLALFKALPGNELVMKPAPSGNGTNPGGQGEFEGDFELVSGADCHDPRIPKDSVWHVTYEVLPPASNTGPKNTLNNEDEYQLGIVANGVMTSGDFTIEFDNKPSNNSMGHQIGMGANDKNANDLGGAFWFYYDLFENGHKEKSGHGDFNFDLTCIGTPTCPTDGGLGNDFNVYVCQDFTAHGSDAQGGVAVGGNATVSGYGIASVSDANGVGLTVGGNLDGTTSQVYNGTAESDTCLPDTDSDPTFNVLGGSLSCGHADGADCTNVCAISDFIASRTDDHCTVTANPWGGVSIEISDTKAVCTLDTDTVASTFQSWVWHGWINGITFSTSGVNAGHVDSVIVNITGDQDIWGKTGSFDLGGISAHAVVWNFGCDNKICDSHDDLELSNVGIKGSLVAPDCAVDFTNGHIDGQYIVESHHGNGEFHDFGFTGDICP